jgi:probable F420-dependent oxidoreductase
MILDALLPPVPLSSIPSIARAADKMGFDTLWSTETKHDPFLPGALIAEHTQCIRFGTAVAIAFARSPQTLAQKAWDLSEMSDGRFKLGLGTQVKAHIVRRFGMAWPESAVGKLREQIQAVRAFWHTWQSGDPLNFRGKYYKLTLMTPFFNPGPIDHPKIPIYIAGVNKGLARLAGELADGFLIHPLHSELYLKEALLPAIAQGAANSSRSLSDIDISATAFVVTSQEEEQFIRSQIAFYASTPSYLAVMSLHGWEDTANELSRLARRQRWGDMSGLIDDKMLATFAVVASVSKLPDAIINRYQGLADRITLYLPFIPGERDSYWRRIIQGIGEK